jgi:hypothetical protein
LNEQEIGQFQEIDTGEHLYQFGKMKNEKLLNVFEILKNYINEIKVFEILQK